MGTERSMKMKLIIAFSAGLAVGIFWMLQTCVDNDIQNTLQSFSVEPGAQESKTTGSGAENIKTPTNLLKQMTETVKDKSESQQESTESNKIENTQGNSSISKGCDKQSTSFNVDSISDKELIELYRLKNIGNPRINFGKQLRMVEGFGPLYQHYRLVTGQDSMMKRRNWENVPIVLEDYKVVHFGLPKVATTQFKELYIRMTMKENSPKAYKDQVNDPRTNGLKYLSDYSYDQATVMMNSNDWTRVMFLRNPVKRFLSAYFDKVARHYNESTLVGPNSTSYMHVYPVSFENWVLFCEVGTTGSPDATNKLKALKFSDEIIKKNSFLCQSDQHFMTQANIHSGVVTKWLDKINFWGHFENVEHDVKILLKDRLGNDVWEKYGATGWGESMNDSIFHRQQRPGHATHSGDKYDKYVIRAGLYDRIRAMEDRDYQVFNNLYKWE